MGIRRKNLIPLIYGVQIMTTATKPVQLSKSLVKKLEKLGFNVDYYDLDGFNQFFLYVDGDNLLGDDYCDTPYAKFTIDDVGGIHLTHVCSYFAKYRVEDAPIWFTTEAKFLAYAKEVVKVLKAHPDFKG